MERFLEGEMEKYNNTGVVCNESPLLQAFSHFSWVASGKSLVICDLQGVESVSSVALTDPSIHSLDAGFFGPTDLGTEGIRSFL